MRCKQTVTYQAVVGGITEEEDAEEEEMEV